MEWPAFDWLHIECFPSLIQLSSLLPQKEDNLRNRVTRVFCLLIEFELFLFSWKIHDCSCLYFFFLFFLLNI